MIIAVDFDGTIVDHRYPDVGDESPGAFQWLKRFQDAGANLMLWTMRGNEYLQDAVEFCQKNGVEFWGVNCNPDQVVWTNSNKQYAHLYIDDAAFGCPLRQHPRSGSRECVDWSVVGPRVLEMIEGWGK